VQLYGLARRLLISADNVQAMIRRPVSAAPVRIASSPTIAESRLPQVLADLAAAEPGLAAEVITANSELVRELVRDGRCDLGIAGLDPYAPPDDGLEERVVWRDEVVVIVPPGHPWEALEEIPVEEFARTAIVQRDPWAHSTRLVSASLDRVGVSRADPVVAIGSTRGVITAALSTGTPAQLSLIAAREHLDRGFAIRRVEGMRFDCEYALVWVGSIVDLAPLIQSAARYVIDLPFARSRRNGRELSLLTGGATDGSAGGLDGDSARELGDSPDEPGDHVSR
jgi:DNA-binding transcriptional LysR family regulator